MDTITVTDAGATVQDTYPTTPDAEGFYYETEEEFDAGISTKEYDDNSNKVKKTVLSNGKIAVVRELRAKETKDIQRFMGNDKEKYLIAGITVATLIDGEKQPYEWFEALKMKDYNKLLSMFSDLNF